MYLFFRDLAIILIAAKFFGLIARKLKAPQVVGEIIAGLLIGPSLLGVVQLSDTITVFAEIGVICNSGCLRGCFCSLGGRYAAVWCVLWSGCYRQSGIL